jgi:hypothetical protein
VANAYFDSTDCRFEYINTDFASYYNQVNSEHQWYTAPSGTAGNAITFTQAMTLDASGRLGIGTTSPSSTLVVASSDPAILVKRGALTGLLINQYDSSGNASINLVDSANLLFATGNTERMRIDSSGNLLVGTTSFPGAGTTTTGAAFGSSGSVSVFRTAATPAYIGRSNDGEVMALYSGATQRGAVSISGATTTYGSVSDYRLKENVVPLTGAITKVILLKPSTFNFIEFPEQNINGFIAHEVAEVEPIAVTGEKDGLNEDGNPIYQGVDMAKLVPLLTAAIQEQQAIINDLKARIETLESK